MPLLAHRARSAGIIRVYSVMPHQDEAIELTKTGKTGLFAHFSVGAADFPPLWTKPAGSPIVRCGTNQRAAQEPVLQSMLRTEWGEAKHERDCAGVHCQ